MEPGRFQVTSQFLGSQVVSRQPGRFQVARQVLGSHVGSKQQSRFQEAMQFLGSQVGSRQPGRFQAVRQVLGSQVGSRQPGRFQVVRQVLGRHVCSRQSGRFQVVMQVLGSQEYIYFLILFSWQIYMYMKLCRGLQNKVYQIDDTIESITFFVIIRLSFPYYQENHCIYIFRTIGDEVEKHWKFTKN